MKPAIKIKKPELLGNYGFRRIRDPHDVFYDEDDKERYYLCIGDGRRGRSYDFLIINNEMLIYASEADGDGGCTNFSEEILQTLIQMRTDGVI